MIMEFDEWNEMSPILGYIIYGTMIEMTHRNTDDKRDDTIIQLINNPIFSFSSKNIKRRLFT